MSPGSRRGEIAGVVRDQDMTSPRRRVITQTWPALGSLAGTPRTDAVSKFACEVLTNNVHFNLAPQIKLRAIWLTGVLTPSPNSCGRIVEKRVRQLYAHPSQGCWGPSSHRNAPEARQGGAVSPNEPGVPANLPSLPSVVHSVHRLSLHFLNKIFQGLPGRKCCSGH